MRRLRLLLPATISRVTAAANSTRKATSIAAASHAPQMAEPRIATRPMSHSAKRPANG